MVVQWGILASSPTTLLSTRWPMDRDRSAGRHRGAGIGALLRASERPRALKRGRRYVHCSNRSRWRLWKRGRGTLSRSVVVTTLTGERRSFDCWLIGYHGITTMEHQAAHF